MPKTWDVRCQEGNHVGWMIYCPACQAHHHIDHRWSFNGDYDKPTFGPSEPGGASSLLVKTNHPGWKSYNPEKDEAVCHSHITDGKIIYCPDCSHTMAGQTADLIDKNDVFTSDA